MRLLVDDRWLHDGGIGRQARNLLARPPADIDIEYLGKSWAIKDPISPYRLAREITARKPNKFWSPGFMPPMKTRIPSSIMIHDLIHLEFGSKLQKFYYNHVIRPLAKQCETIFTVSNYSKEIIADWLQINDDRIAVIPNSVEERYFLGDDKFSLEKPYFLYIGNRRIYKNIDRMLTAFAQSGLSKDYFFLLSGYADDKTTAKIQQLKLEKSIKFCGFIDEARLPSVYRGATALVFVSLSEGFGIPNIEAFATGTPVITANRTAIPEVVGAAALLVDPFSVSEIAIAMSKVSADVDLRSKLIEHGRIRAREFCCERSAKTFWAHFR